MTPEIGKKYNINYLPWPIKALAHMVAILELKRMEWNMAQKRVK